MCTAWRAPRLKGGCWGCPMCGVGLGSPRGLLGEAAVEAWEGLHTLSEAHRDSITIEVIGERVGEAESKSATFKAVYKSGDLTK